MSIRLFSDRTRALASAAAEVHRVIGNHRPSQTPFGVQCSDRSWAAARRRRRPPALDGLEDAKDLRTRTKSSTRAARGLVSVMSDRHVAGPKGQNSLGWNAHNHCLVAYKARLTHDGTRPLLGRCVKHKPPRRVPRQDGLSSSEAALLVRKGQQDSHHPTTGPSARAGSVTRSPGCLHGPWRGQRGACASAVPTAARPCSHLTA
mmetsp:Transcript_9443/g.24468  ORF Transcript_9443/g.24468 Transcript_9443/m.24468 type:complete len:204 (-) Transcript_9443:262-873(-)